MSLRERVVCSLRRSFMGGVLAVPPLTVGDVLLLFMFVVGGVAKLRHVLDGPGRGLPLDVDDDVLVKALSTTLFRNISVAESAPAVK